MSYKMQVNVNGQWTDVCPTGGEPYVYETAEEAAKMLRICYHDQLGAQRLGPPETVRVAVTDAVVPP